MFPHEMALRLVLQMIQTSAGRYKRHIVPLVSCSIDFYLRVFVRVYTSPQQVKKSASKMAIVYECSGCHAYSVQHLGKVTIKETNGAERHTPATGPSVNSLCENCNNIHHVSIAYYNYMNCANIIYIRLAALLGVLIFTTTHS
jgi:tRNA (guanine26-N2/guanine27-N2)-dimethyltransferase